MSPDLRERVEQALLELRADAGVWRGLITDLKAALEAAEQERDAAKKEAAIEADYRRAAYDVKQLLLDRASVAERCRAEAEAKLVAAEARERQAFEALADVLTRFPTSEQLDAVDDDSLSGIRPIGQVARICIADVRRWHAAYRTYQQTRGEDQ